MSEPSTGASFPDIEVVNIVKSGKLNLELDLAAVAEDLRTIGWIEEVEHSRDRGNRLKIYFHHSEAMGILAPTGVYVFTGSDSYEETDKAQTELFRALADLGIISEVEVKESEIVDEFEIKNLVSVGEFEGTENMDLNTLAFGLGLEKVEYEPEQFPALTYRPDSSSCTILVFSTGKVVITGLRDEETAQEEYTKLQNLIKDILN